MLKNAKTMAKDEGIPFIKEQTQLLSYFQSGYYKEAEKLSLFLLKKSPMLDLPWKIRGAILKHKGDLKKALECYKNSVLVAPNDPKNHFNLGNTFEELGLLDQAENSYNAAIDIMPNFSEAHCNLGIVKQRLSRLDEAELSFKTSLEFRPDYFEAYINLGLLLNRQKKFREAEFIFRDALDLQPSSLAVIKYLAVTLFNQERFDEAKSEYIKYLKFHPNDYSALCDLGTVLKSQKKFENSKIIFEKAIRIEPNNSEAYFRLGNVFLSKEQLDKAEAYYRKAILLNPYCVKSMINLALILNYKNKILEERKILEQILKKDELNFGLKAAVNIAIRKFLESDFSACKTYLSISSNIQNKLTTEYKNEKNYESLLTNLLKYDHKNQSAGICTSKEKIIYCIGESHTLSSHELCFTSLEKTYYCKSQLIMGCKQWHLGNDIKNRYKLKFEEIFYQIPKSSLVLLSVGEIDCRIDEGIMRVIDNSPKVKLNELILNTVKNYINYVIKLNRELNHTIIIQGVPCPNINFKNYNLARIRQHSEVIKTFNRNLKEVSKKKKLKFLDLYNLTNDGEGFSNGLWHIDTHHISQGGMLEAWHQFLLSDSI